MDQNIEIYKNNNSGGVPRVSICIPAFENYEGVIRLLLSIHAQNYDDYEVIISDDSCSDKVEKAIDDAVFICGDHFKDKIRYKRNDPPLNVPENWNNSIALARGNYIKIMHHDDWFLDENSLCRYVELLEENNEYSMAFSGSFDTPVSGLTCYSIFGNDYYEKIKLYTLKHGSERRIKGDFISDFRKNRYYILSNNFIGAPSVTIFRRSFLEENGIKYDGNLRWLVDIDYYMQTFEMYAKYNMTDEPLVGVGIDRGQLTNDCLYDTELNISEYEYIAKKYNLSENGLLIRSATDALIRCGASYEVINKHFRQTKGAFLFRKRLFDFRKTKRTIKHSIIESCKVLFQAPRNGYHKLKYFSRELSLFTKCMSHKGQISGVIKRGSFILCFDHKYGGGAAKYLRERIEFGDYREKDVVVIRPTDSDNYFEISCRYKNSWISGYLSGLDSVKRVLASLQVEHILVSEVFEYPDMPGFLRFLTVLKKDYNCGISYCLHDYYCICPVSNLTGKNNVYCGFSVSCDRCMKEYDIFDRYGNIENWRFDWHVFLKECNEIIAFSDDTRSRILGVYPDLKIVVEPHRNYYELRKVRHQEKEEKGLNVGILGSITGIKGLEIIRQMVDIVSMKKYPICFVIIGETVGEPIKESEYFHQTGRYNENELVDIAEKEKIDVFFTPSIVPETFSYTTKEAMEMGLPVFCFNIGAQQEWVRGYPDGHVMEQIDPRGAVKQFLQYMDQFS